MTKRPTTRLRTELKHSKARVAELEATLNAIHSGEVDAIVVNGPSGSRIFTLQGPDDPYRLLAERMNEGAATLNSQGTMLFCNRKLADMLRYPAQKLLGSSFLPLIIEAERQRFESQLRVALTNDVKGEFTLRKADDTTLPVQLSLSSVPMGDCGHGICLVVTDLTSQKQVEHGIRSHALQLEEKITHQRQQLSDVTNGLAASQIQLSNAEEKYRAIFQNAIIGIFQSTVDGRFLSANPALARMLGYDSPEQLISEVSNIGRQIFCDPAQMRQYALLLERNGVVENAEVEVIDKDGNKKWTVANVRLTHGFDGMPILEGTVEDITNRKAAEQQVLSLAHYDQLTQLPNRVLFRKRLSAALASSRRRGLRVAVMFIDIDRFKAINDSLGHSLGDLLLAETARRLRKVTREQDTLGRLGGDEFVLALADVKDLADAAMTAERLLKATREETLIHEISLSVTCSVGISIFPDHGTNCETLLQNADAAMYRAKDNGRNTFQFFTDDMHTQAVERLAMQNALRCAIQKQELFLVYQAQVDLTHDKIIGAEALLRWHNTYGLVAPTAFIPVAENTGLIIPIGNWVITTACEQARRWLDEGLSLRVGVNISLLQLRRDDFASMVETALNHAGLPPQLLELEITESVLLDETDAVSANLNTLYKLGTTLSIDDFGTGYSSFPRLISYPVCRVKIDRSFVHGIPVDPIAMAIVGMIIDMAHTLSLSAIAEGVETEEQVRWLKQRGCDEVQGFYYCDPLEASEFTDKIRSEAMRHILSSDSSISNASNQRHLVLSPQAI